MASQVAHIIYSEKYFEKFPAMAEKFDRFQFFLGSTFPDIRRIDPNIKRQYTHIFFPRVDLNFDGLNAFAAGWKFHLYCDMKREEILNKYNFYSLKHTTDFYNLPAKLFEDKVIYDRFSDWFEIIEYFNNVPKIEGLNISSETFALWYAILAKYFEKKPDEKTMRIFISKQPGVARRAIEISECIGKLQHNKRVVEILLKVADEIV